MAGSPEKAEKEEAQVVEDSPTPNPGSAPNPESGDSEKPVLKKPSAKNPPSTPTKSMKKDSKKAIPKSTPKKTPQKPSGKPGAKSKAQAKAKQVKKNEKKGKGKGGVLKKPSAKTESGTKETEKKNSGKNASSSSTQKKPACSEETKKGKRGWNEGLQVEEEKDEEMKEEGEEEYPHETDDVVNDEFQMAVVDPVDDMASVDRSKKQKFLQMLTDGSLPSYIKQEWTKSLTLKTGKLELQRRLINSAFDRTEQGKLLLSLNKPLFQALRSSWSKKTATTAEKSLPKTLFCGKFNLTPDMFEEGLQNGDFMEVKASDGRLQYTWKTDVHKFQVGEQQSSSAKNQVQGEKGDGAAFNKMASNWKMGLFVKNTAGGSAPKKGSGRAQLAICDQQAPLSDVQWQEAQGQLKPAQDAFEKCIKDGLRYLQQIGPDNKSDSLYGTLFLGLH